MLFCAALVMAAQTVWAVDLRFSGEYRVRAFSTENLFDARSSGGCGTPAGSCNDKQRFADMRFRLTTSATAGVATGAVTLDFLNTFSGLVPPSQLTEPSSANSGTGDYRFGTSGFGGSINAVGVREAYLKLSWPGATVFAGRHRIVLGHSIVFDDTADGVTLVVPFALWQSQVSVSYLEIFNDNATMPFNSGNNTDLYLVHAQANPSPSQAFSVYGGLLRDRGPTLLNCLISPCPPGQYGAVDKNGVPEVPAGTDLSPASGTVYLAGATYDAQVGPSTFKLEFDALRGYIDSVPVINDSLALEGFDLMAEQDVDLGRVTVGLLFVYASGSGADDFGETGKASTGINLSDISPNFVLGNILVNGETISDRDGSTLDMGGFRGGLNQGGAGLLAVKLSANGDIRPGLNLEGAVIYAKTVDPVIPEINSASASYCPIETPGTPPPGSPSCKADDRLGWELDLNVNWQVDPNLQLKAGGGILIADNAFSGLYNNDFTKLDSDPITKLSFKAVYRF